MTEPLLPGDLVGMFLTMVEDEEQCTAFMKRPADEDEEDACGEYWKVVHKWMYDDEGDEEPIEQEPDSE